TVPLYRDGIAALLERTPWAQIAAHSASQQGALLMTEQLMPDIVLLDSGLAPSGHLVELLTANKHHARVVVLVRDAARTPRCVRAPLPRPGTGVAGHASRGASAVAAEWQ